MKNTAIGNLISQNRKLKKKIRNSKKDAEAAKSVAQAYNRQLVWISNELRRERAKFDDKERNLNYQITTSKSHYALLYGLILCSIAANIYQLFLHFSFKLN